jgi:hypothetical protein
MFTDVFEEQTSSILRVKEETMRVSARTMQQAELWLLVACLAYSSTLKIEVVRLLEMLTNLY